MKIRKHTVYSERLYISDYKQNLTNNIMDPFLRYIVITVSPWIGNENVESIFWTRSAFSYFSLNANSLFRLVEDIMVAYINIIDMNDDFYFALKNICSLLDYYTNYFNIILKYICLIHFARIYWNNILGGFSEVFCVMAQHTSDN